jgi:transposase InsO family protein
MQKKAAVEMVVGMGLCKRHRACRVMGLSRSTAYYRREPRPEKLAQEGLVEEVSRSWPCLGYEKVARIVRDEHGQVVNAKRVARIRRQRGLLASRGRGGKRRRVRPGLALRHSAEGPDMVWSYDFIQDSTAEGGSVRILSIIDEYTRECLLLRAARSFPARRVIDALEEVMVCTGRKPQYLRSDNGPEFVAKSVQKWLEEVQIGPRYIEPGSPWENAHVESFHAQVRLELLDRELFLDLREVNAAISDYAYQYNFKRPHGSLDNRPPSVAAQRELPLRPTACAPVRAGLVPMNH